MLRSYIRAGSGVAFALAVLELALRPLSTPNLPPIAEPRADSIGSLAVETRQLEEGIGTSHFSLAGARLTGNAAIPDAATIVILGDSHVVAREISDDETMGAWVERLARKDLHLVNVRQYGWRGASPPQYLLVANDVLARWNPAQVVVVLDGDDLGADPLNRRFPRMRILPNDSVEIVSDPEHTKPSGTDHYSTLATLARIRWQQVVERAPKSVRYWLNARVERRGPQPDAAEIAAVPRAEVKALARAFGSRLLIVYTADVRATGGEKMDPGEERLLDACAAQQVRCISMRSLMLAARRNGIVVRGFSTTTLGVGHLNAKGHELVGRTIWSELSRQDARYSSKLAKQ